MIISWCYECKSHIRFDEVGPYNWCYEHTNNVEHLQELCAEYTDIISKHGEALAKLRLKIARLKNVEEDDGRC